MVLILWSHFTIHLNSLNFTFQESVICKGSKDNNYLQPRLLILITADISLGIVLGVKCRNHSHFLAKFLGYLSGQVRNSSYLLGDEENSLRDDDDDDELDSGRKKVLVVIGEKEF